MLSPWLDMDMMMPPTKIIGLSRTHGEQAGVKAETSESEEEMVLAVSTAILLLPKLLSKYYFTIYLLKAYNIILFETSNKFVYH